MEIYHTSYYLLHELGMKFVFFTFDVGSFDILISKECSLSKDAFPTDFQTEIDIFNGTTLLTTRFFSYVLMFLQATMLSRTLTRLTLQNCRKSNINVEDITVKLSTKYSLEHLHVHHRRVNATTSYFSTGKLTPQIPVEVTCRERFKTTLLSSKLRTMKLETPAFNEIFTPELGKLTELFKKYGYELRIAGGAVRDLILGKLPHDIDFATTATPNEMKAMFEKENIRMINTKGESHGTITCRINDKENFEVTTLRIDIQTDGRHAEVAFTKDWELDALRRDLTINSMFLGFDGTIYDHFNGREDLLARKVRFVGSAADRIQEDYLRILRYFRFYGRISEDGNIHEPGTLSAIKANVDGLDRISGERIWVEMKKILIGRHAPSIIRVMIECSLAPHIGLGDKCNFDEFEKRFEMCKDLEPLPMTLMAALLSNEEEVYKLNERIKMSKNELRLGVFIIEHRDDELGDDKVRYCQDLLCDTVGKEPRTKEKIVELLKYLGHVDVIQQFNQWDLPKFPVNGISLLQAGVPKGPTLAIALDGLRKIWKESRYTLTETELMQYSGEYIKGEN